MKKKLLGATFAVTLLMGLAGATPASARADDTLTVICSGGQVVVSDASSFTGQTTANGAYNLVNPFGEVCTVYP